MPWPAACAYLAVCEVQTSRLSTKLARPPQKHCWHDNRRGIKWLVTWHGQGWGDKAGEHNHRFHGERLHNNQRCTKIGANNKMFCANYPRDIQKVQGCRLSCTAEAGGRAYCSPAHRDPTSVTEPCAAVHRRRSSRKGEETGEQKKNKEERGANICHPKPELRLWDGPGDEILSERPGLRADRVTEKWSQMECEHCEGLQPIPSHWSGPPSPENLEGEAQPLLRQAQTVSQ